MFLFKLIKTLGVPLISTGATEVSKPVFFSTIQVKMIRGMHPTAPFATFFDLPSVFLPADLIFQQTLPNHLVNTTPTVPCFAFLIPRRKQIIGRSNHSAERTGSHFAIPNTLGFSLAFPMMVLFLTVKTFLKITITGRCIFPELCNGLHSSALTTALFSYGTGDLVNFHSAVMTVHIVSFFMKKTTIVFSERFNLFASLTLKLRNPHDERCLHFLKNN
jgi:hypothetical protein